MHSRPVLCIHLLASATLRRGKRLSARRVCVRAASKHGQLRPHELDSVVTAACKARANAAAVLREAPFVFKARADAAQ